MIGDSRCFYVGWALVYSLSDLNGNLFYVGATGLTLAERLAWHLSEAKHKDSPKGRKIISLNYEVTINCIDKKLVTGRVKGEAPHKIRDLEYKWIEKLRNDGVELVNVHPVTKVPSRI